MSRSKNSHKPAPTILHGPKTRAALIEKLKQHDGKKARLANGPRVVPDAEVATVHAKEINREICTGKHRLVEDRCQHDVAEKKSDKNRLAADAKKHKHGNPRGKLNGGATHP